MSDWKERIKQWAADRNLIKGPTPMKQMDKLDEEVVEPYGGLTRSETESIKDAIGVSRETENKWQRGPVQLMSGETAFIDAINPGQEDYRYTGRYNLYGNWIPAGWDHTGRAKYAYADSPSSLAPPLDKIDIGDSESEVQSD